MNNDKVWVPTATDRALFDDLRAHARTMRKQPTMAEELLWRQLRGKQFKGLKFRRQHPIDRFIVDFYCRSARLVIEVDGSAHDAPEVIAYDEARQQYLEERGLRLLRFQNDQVLYDMDSVLHDITRFLSRIDKSPEKRKRCLGMTNIPPLKRGDRGG